MQDPSYVALGASVREAREAAGLSQQTLATQAGIALRTLVRIEKGEDTKLGTLSLVAKALGITAHDLLLSAARPSPSEGVKG